VYEESGLGLSTSVPFNQKKAPRIRHRSLSVHAEHRPGDLREATHCPQVGLCTCYESGVFKLCVSDLPPGIPAVTSK